MVVLCAALGGTSVAARAETLPLGTREGKVSSRYEGEPLAIATRDESPAAEYVVLPGDTLWRLSRRFATTVATLTELNRLTDATALRVGQRLRLPSPAAAAPNEEAAPAPSAEPTSKNGEQPQHGLQRDAGTAGPAPAAAPKTEARNASRRYALRWPVDGTVTSRFGRRNGRGHDGIDISAKQGAPVSAAADGEVLFSAAHGGYGNLILVRHADGLVTVYAHNERNLVRKGQRVRAGQHIARVGETGQTSGPHLHFEVRRGVQALNPLQFLPP